ncbi:uncharacterized protein LOC131933272 [Physella acuta]|uniref:uncharacterized protein LOC131933272 n=1 Tax=Physella acuta TaxID=109671 RepID=UPI0027DE99A6|nr:uncharacterized protein LOC131933272 [Physella acuta]
MYLRYCFFQKLRDSINIKFTSGNRPYFYFANNTKSRSKFGLQSQSSLLRSVPKCNIHITSLLKKLEPSAEPYKFTSSAANIKTLPDPVDRNKYQSIIVSISLAVFMIYFLFLREENDLDKKLSVTLFERVPHLEETHLRHEIKKMREKGEDTSEAETRLKEVINKNEIK